MKNIFTKCDFKFNQICGYIIESWGDYRLFQIFVRRISLLILLAVQIFIQTVCKKNIFWLPGLKNQPACRQAGLIIPIFIPFMEGVSWKEVSLTVCGLALVRKINSEHNCKNAYSSRTKFDTKFILKIHKMALSHLYSFAGRLRDVNLSKGGFPFASAKFLPETMSAFDKEILSQLPDKYNSKEDLIKDIGVVHGELLFIHPFREGNGRTARLISNLMSRKAGYEGLMFEKVGKKEFEKYIVAVQNCANKDYKKMTEFIRSIFPE